MDISTSQFRTLIKLLLPEEIFTYFELHNIEVKNNEVHAFLDELNIIPNDYKDEKSTSKGFYPTSTIQDFPIRDKPLFLHVRRRRWQIDSTGEVVSRNWNTVAKGTRLTKDFATFLKGLYG